MKVKYRTTNDRLEFELEGSNDKELFKALSSAQEVFDQNVCGCCGKDNVRFVVRNVDDNDFFEIQCKDCRAKLSMGQHKKGNSLFPKRTDKDGNWMKNQGWHKWTPNGESSVPEAEPTQPTQKVTDTKKKTHTATEIEGKVPF